jgi:hypothetical protein
MDEAAPTDSVSKPACLDLDNQLVIKRIDSVGGPQQAMEPSDQVAHEGANFIRRRNCLTGAILSRMDQGLELCHHSVAGATRNRMLPEERSPATVSTDASQVDFSVYNFSASCSLICFKSSLVRRALILCSWCEVQSESISAHNCVSFSGSAGALPTCSESAFKAVAGPEIMPTISDSPNAPLSTASNERSGYPRFFDSLT